MMTYFESYENFEFEDFIEDADFRTWVLEPNTENEQFWNAYRARYPTKNQTIEEARSLLLSVKTHFEKDDRPEAQLNTQVSRLLRKKVTTAASKTARMEHVDRNVGRATPKSRRWQNSVAISIAAAMLLLLGVFAWLLLNAEQDAQLYTTSYGEWKQVELLDGSEVDLNANSELKLAKNWSEGEVRQVWLKGEAFFNVQKIPDGKRFQVITEDLIIEVLGTAFNVQSRGHQTEVFLKEGKIKLNFGDKEEFLTAGDFIAFSAKEQKVIARRSVPQEVYTGWKDGVLELHNASIAEILKKVQEIYGVDFEINDTSLLKQERTIALPMKDLEIVIPILELSLDIKIIKDGNRMIIR